MRKKIITTAIFTTLLFTGCAQKAPDLDGAGRNNISDATQIVGDNLDIYENQYGSQRDGDIESYNSSSNGFRSIYFAFGDYDISSTMEDYIIYNAKLVNTLPNSKIKIEGNCDEFGTDEYNYALGLKRAKAVKDAIMAQGIDANRMTIVSFGESNPVCHEPTDECYARNRRVDIRVLK